VSFIETVFGGLLSALLGVVTFFDNLKPRRGDDPGTARYRSLKRACVISTMVPFVVLGLGLLAANFLDAFGAAFQNPQTLDDLRSTLADGLLGLLALSTLVAGYKYWLLWRFERGDDNFV
jgi:hypothetical protein